MKTKTMPMMIIQTLESHAVMTQQVNQSEMSLLEGRCRGQDSNLRTIEDWDLIPAPLTKLGNPCFKPTV